MTHEQYIDIATIISKSSYCEKTKVGCVLVKDNTIISIGYNGMPSGFNNTCELNGKTNKEVLHAESNAITKCAKSAYSSENSIMYCTYSPCLNCAKLIIQSGIKEVVYLNEYRLNDGKKLLEKANIKTWKIIRK